MAEAEPRERPAFYALAGGGWRDYVTLLHPPYTVWHLSYVAIGAATAPVVNGARLGASVLAFFLGVGLSAHALDEMAGRPLATGIPDRALWAIALLALAGAVALGVIGAAEVSWWLLAFVGFGAFIVFAYNLEVLGGRFHSDLWFAAAWGAFPALTGAFAQTGSMRWQALPVAAACLLLSAAQRRLSTPVRRLRREVVAVEGSMRLRDGSETRLDEKVVLGGHEAALRAMSAAMALLAGGLVAARLVR